MATLMSEFAKLFARVLPPKPHETTLKIVTETREGLRGELQILMCEFDVGTNQFTLVVREPKMES